MPSCSTKDAISWNAASDHLNTKVTVIGQVFDIQSSDQRLTLVMGSANVGPDKRLDIILTKNALDDYSGDPEQIFQDNQICVYGVIEDVQGHLQMVVDQAKDIELL